jgi:tetratricopeptide (TPR) repeat protein
MRNHGGVSAVLSVALAVLLAIPSVAFAQNDKRAAANHFQRASGLYAAQRYDEALDEFKAGYEAFPLPGFLVNIGQCYRKLEKLEEAAEAFGKFLDGHPRDERLRSEVEEAYAEVKGELDRRAQAEAKRKHDEEEARRALLTSIAAQQKRETPDLTVHASSPVVELRAAPEPPRKKRSRWWVWTIVGVGVAGAVAAGVALGVTYGQPQGPQPGSLGLIDGRRP